MNLRANLTVFEKLGAEGQQDSTTTISEETRESVLDSIDTVVALVAANDAIGTDTTGGNPPKEPQTPGANRFRSDRIESHRIASDLSNQAKAPSGDAPPPTERNRNLPVFPPPPPETPVGSKPGPSLALRGGPAGTRFCRHSDGAFVGPNTVLPAPQGKTGPGHRGRPRDRPRDRPHLPPGGRQRGRHRPDRERAERNRPPFQERGKERERGGGPAPGAGVEGRGAPLPPGPDPLPAGATPSPGRATSVGARRSGSATRARAGRSSLSRLTDAVRTGSASVAASNRNEPCESNQDESESEHEPPGMVWYRCDVTDASEVDSVVRQILEEEGDIDVLVNNAGGSQSLKGPVGTLDGEDLESLLRLNVVGPNLVTSAVCKHSPSWKRMEAGEGEKVVLNVSSKAGKVGLENYSFYVATKFALEGLTSSWSKELARYGVRVHSISPGMVDTKSFPKPAGKKGVREASSIRECLLLALAGRIPPSPPEDGGDASDGKVIENMMDYTGHYIHVDEFDQVVREKGIGEAHLAWKPIDEAPFRV